MKTTFQEEINNATSLLDVLLILKKATMLDTHVSTLAYLEQNILPFNGKYGIWTCKPFPLEEDQPEYQINSYYFTADGNSLKKGSIVNIVFTDKNFINNLNAYDDKPKQTRDLSLHLIKYGVIISLPTLGLTEEEKEEVLDF